MLEEKKPIKEKKTFFQRFKKTIIGSSIFLILLLLFANWLGFQHIPHHVSYLWHNTIGYRFDDSYNNDKGIAVTDAEIATAAAAGVDTAVTEEAPMSPLDTVMWSNSMKRGDYIPDQVKEEMAKIRKIDFKKLEITGHKPSNEEAQTALVRQFGEEMANLLSSNDAKIRIGTCYKAKLKTDNPSNVETARVTAMVSAFNSKGVNLGNIQLPLTTVYDFVQFESDPGTWYVTDFSQTLPFDYKLNKD